MSDSPSSGKPVVVARFPTVEEAHMAASKLAAEGVEAQVEPYHSFDMLTGPQQRFSRGGIGVIVLTEQLEEARRILESVHKAVADEPQESESDTKTGDTSEDAPGAEPQ